MTPGHPLSRLSATNGRPRPLKTTPPFHTHTQAHTSLPTLVLSPNFTPFIFSWEPTPGSQTDCRNKSCVFPVLCSILFILYPCFYILYFLQSIWLPRVSVSVCVCVWESPSLSGAVVMRFLFNMPLFFLFYYFSKGTILVIYHGDTSVNFYSRTDKWLYNFNKGTNSWPTDRRMVLKWFSMYILTGMSEFLFMI